MSKHRNKQKRTRRIKFAKAEVTTVTPPSPVLVGTMRGVPFVFNRGAFSFTPSF